MSLARHRRQPTGALILPVIATLLLAAPARAQDRPLPLGEGQDLQELTGEAGHELQITGFAVGNYSYAGRTRENSFAASKIALSLFRELSDHVWIFGQLTTALEDPEEEGGDPVTEIEIDNLLVNLTPPGLSNLSLSFGKFDIPLGFERDDEPLNLQPTTSFNFELGRPAKMVGVVGRWALSPQADLTVMGGNGWNSEIDPNELKTGGVRLGVLPSEHVSLGLGGMFGNEGAEDETTERYLLSFDYAVQPASTWIIGGEANWGGDHDAAPGGGDAQWYGATMTLFHRLVRRFGVVARAEVLRDRDGARTGVPQTLTSYTLAPLYFLGTGREGIFANVEHTTFRIPRLQVRAEARLDHSSEPVFADGDGNPDTWDLNFVFQIVATF